MKTSPEIRETALPGAIHIVVVVYGKAYSQLLAEITLANLAAMVCEIPEALRQSSALRILTTRDDMATIEASPVMPLLRQRIRVELCDMLQMAGFEKHSMYGPMVLTQRLAVIAAARENAALFFVGPDQIYSRGSFANFIERLKQGYRVIVGPGPRIHRAAAREFLLRQISSSPDGTFALTHDLQADLLFRHWHPINDQFVMQSPDDIAWKAYIFFRPRPDELFIRFFQGPTLVAWPRGNLENFDGFIDHDLVDYCCQGPHEAYVIPDSRECLSLDLTDSVRLDESMKKSRFPRADLLVELFDHSAVKDAQLRYGLRSCRVHRGERDSVDIDHWERQLSSAIDPLILIALSERRLSGWLGWLPSAIYRVLALLNVSTLCFLLQRIGPRLRQPRKQ